MKKKKIALIFIFVLSFTIVSVLAVTQTTRAEAYSMNLPTCEYEYNSNYTGTSYSNTYTYEWEDLVPISTETEFDYFARKTITKINVPSMSNVKVDALCRIGKNSSSYDYDRQVAVTSIDHYFARAAESLFIFKSMGYTAHFAKTVDPNSSYSGQDYKSNKWEDFNAELYDLGFKGRWIYD